MTEQNGNFFKKKLNPRFRYKENGNSEGGGETPSDITMQDVDTAIATHNDDQDSHIIGLRDYDKTDVEISPPYGTHYQFAKLNSITLHDIPQRWQPIVIQFQSISTSFGYKDDLIPLNDIKPPPNSHCEITIINHRISLASYEQ